MNVIINGKPYEVTSGLTILDAASSVGIQIPTLCYLKDINKISSCRICVVQVNHSPKLLPACSTKITEGMEIETDNPIVRNARKMALELLCSDHKMECDECSSGAYCTLRNLCHEYEVDDRAFGKGNRLKLMDESTTYLVRDNSKCILCRRCLSTCAVIQGTGAIAFNNKGASANIGFTHGIQLKDTRCIGCGQCVKACPTGALSVKDDTKAVWKALYDKDKCVVLGISSNTYQAFGKYFYELSYDEQTIAGKMVAILKAIGFDFVIDSSVMDEDYQNAVLDKIAGLPKKEGIPYLSSNCQGWKNYVKLHHPELKERIIDMPQKSEFVAAECKKKLADKEVFYVDISNCLSAKTSTLNNVDVHLTTVELFRLIRRACVSNFTANKVWSEIPPMAFDRIGVESLPSKKTIEHNLETIVVSGMRNAMAVVANHQEVDFIEIYACPDGCENGGGA